MIRVGDPILAERQCSPACDGHLVFGSVVHVDVHEAVVCLLRDGQPGPLFRISHEDAAVAGAFLEGYLEEAGTAAESWHGK